MDAEYSGTASSFGSLQRGKACINCRRRKMRCDGTKPICGPCIRSNRSEDCEYTDSQGRTRTQLLEENITRLESRIHELEHPDEIPLTVTLHDPYTSRHGSPSDRASSSAMRGGRRASSTSSAESSSGGYHNLTPGGSPLPASENADMTDEPPLHIRQQLVDGFLRNASQFGFFLNASLFPLLTTVYLWGLHLSRSDALREREPAFLSRALQHTSNALSGSHPQQFLHALQAEILLAYYFFQNGRFLEGKYHSSAAASLAISGGLNKIRSAGDSSSTASFVDDRSAVLPPPRDAVDEGERINGFWTALVLDKCWSVALGSTSNFTDVNVLGTRIDTPWPLDNSAYEQGHLQPDVLSSSTVQKFMSGTLNLEEGRFSAHAIHAQAALLFERATHVAAQWKTDISPIEATAFRADFVALDKLMDNFQNYLPPIDQFQPLTTHDTRDLLVTFSLAYAATIQLHKNFSSRNANSNTKCLAATSALVKLLNNANLSEAVYVNPIMGTLLMVACQVLITEVLRLRTHRSTSATGFPVRDESQLISSVQSVMGTMATLAVNCPIITFQVAKVQEAYATI